MVAPPCLGGSGALQASQPQRTRTSYGSLQCRQRRQRGRGAKAAQQENAPELMASTLGSLPGPAASRRHLAQDTQGTTCATGTPVPAAPHPAQPAAHRLCLVARTRVPAASPDPRAAM